MAPRQSSANPLNLPPPIPKEDILKPEKSRSQVNCEAKGGTWDEATKTCKLPEKEVPAPEKTERLIQDGKTFGATIPDGRTFLGLSDRDARRLAAQQAEKQAEEAALFQPEGTARAIATQQFEGQQLAGQVGQLDRQAISPTGLSTEEALRVGIVDAIPSAIKSAGALAGAGAVLGAGAGAVGGPLAPATVPAGAGIGAAIGGAAGFVSSLASSMKSNFASQRRDTTTAQQRVLDEGKQNMNDWVTMATNDPANKNEYLAEYNKQSSQIEQAYRQMKLDTSRDVAKFETALPNLAEFEAFYSAGGERDALDSDMRNALLSVSPEGYDMLELTNRRLKNEG